MVTVIYFFVFVNDQKLKYNVKKRIRYPQIQGKLKTQNKEKTKEKLKTTLKSISPTESITMSSALLLQLKYLISQIVTLAFAHFFAFLLLFSAG